MLPESKPNAPDGASDRARGHGAFSLHRAAITGGRRATQPSAPSASAPSLPTRAHAPGRNALASGRQKARSYFTEVAENLPNDTVILTAGCAKYRYNKLALGDIGGIPRILDAGQCNDCYSLAVIALKLKEAFGLNDINELPVSYDIAWYEQKAVAVLLALLHLGINGIRLGPTLPAFLSPNVVKVLVEKFDIKPIGTVEEDIAAMMAGK